MDPVDVPLDEMRRSDHDPLEDALRGAPDDPAIGALVHDLRAAYVPSEPPARSAALTSFTGGPGPVRSASPSVADGPAAVPLRGRLRPALAAIGATLAGKVLLGGAVAAAAVGGLHAAEVVDVPLLPEVRRSGPVVDPAPPGDVGLEAGEPPVVADPDPFGPFTAQPPPSDVGADASPSGDDAAGAVDPASPGAVDDRPGDEPAGVPDSEGAPTDPPADAPSTPADDPPADTPAPPASEAPDDPEPPPDGGAPAGSAPPAPEAGDEPEAPPAGGEPGAP